MRWVVRVKGSTMLYRYDRGGHWTCEYHAEPFEVTLPDRIVLRYWWPGEPKTYPTKREAMRAIRDNCCPECWEAVRRPDE